jgi:hypothetical protein
MQTYDIVHHGWPLNEYPINEIDVMDKFNKWSRYFKPLEVVPSEAAYTRPARSSRPHDTTKQIQEHTGTTVSGL